MLSEREQRALEEIERSLTAGADEPSVPGPPSRPRRRRRTAEHPVVRALTAVGGAAALLLLVLGVPEAAGAVATATVLVWWLWRYWPQLGDRGDIAPPLPSPQSLRRRATCRRRRRLLVEHLRRRAEAE